MFRVGRPPGGPFRALAALGLAYSPGFSDLTKGEQGVKKKLLQGIAVLGLCLCLQGCLAAAAVYGVSRYRTHKTYNEYVASMEKTNQERQSQGLEPLPVASFKEWKKAGKPGKPGE